MSNGVTDTDAASTSMISSDFRLPNFEVSLAVFGDILVGPLSLNLNSSQKMRTNHEFWSSFWRAPGIIPLECVYFRPTTGELIACRSSCAIQLKKKKSKKLRFKLWPLRQGGSFRCELLDATSTFAAHHFESKRLDQNV